MDSKNVSGLNQNINNLNENLRVTLSTSNERGHQTVIRSSHTSALLSKNPHEPQEIDLHIKTNVAVEVNKKIKVYLLLNFSFSIVILFISCIFIIELKSELKHVKHNVSTLEQEILKLITQSDHFHLNLTNVADKLQFKSKEKYVDDDASVLISEPIVNDSIKHKIDILDHKSINAQKSEKQVTSIVQFRGRIPEYNATSGGSKLGPWVLDNSIVNMDISSKFSLEDYNSTIQILDGGLYSLYSQLFYETKSEKNSYSIMLKTKDETTPRSVASCSTDGQMNLKSPIDMSCFTSIIHYLKYGDKIYIQQREQNRKIIMKKGYSFFGLMKINS